MKTKLKVYVCEKCSGLVNDSAHFCGHCGSRFDAHKKTGYGVRVLMEAGLTQDKALAVMSYHRTLGKIRTMRDTKSLLRFKYLKEHLSEEDAQKVIDFVKGKKLVAMPSDEALDARRFRSRTRRLDEDETVGEVEEEEIEEASYEVGEEVVVEEEDGTVTEAIVTDIYEDEEGEVVYSVETEDGEEFEVTEEDIEAEGSEEEPEVIADI